MDVLLPMGEAGFYLTVNSFYVATLDRRYLLRITRYRIYYETPFAAYFTNPPT